jgi:hypothetical protein
LEYILWTCIFFFLLPQFILLSVWSIFFTWCNQFRLVTTRRFLKKTLILCNQFILVSAWSNFFSIYLIWCSQFIYSWAFGVMIFLYFYWLVLCNQFILVSAWSIFYLSSLFILVRFWSIFNIITECLFIITVYTRKILEYF